MAQDYYLKCKKMRYLKNSVACFFLCCFILMFGCLCLPQAVAQTQSEGQAGQTVNVLLKSDITRQGELIEETDRYIRLDILGLPMTFYFDEVKSINGQSVEQYLRQGIEATVEENDWTQDTLDEESYNDEDYVVGEDSTWQEQYYDDPDYIPDASREPLWFEQEYQEPAMPSQQIDEELLSLFSEDWGVQAQAQPYEYDQYQQPEAGSIQGAPLMEWTREDLMKQELAQEIVDESGQGEPVQESAQVQDGLEPKDPMKALIFSSKETRIAEIQKILASGNLKAIILPLIFGLLFSLLTHLYYSFCLYRMMKKLNKGPLWLAWIPMVNFMFCPLIIANVSLLWLFSYLLMIIPIVNLFAFLFLTIFSIYVTCKMATALNKPWWLGIVGYIPIIAFISNPVVYGYLAFSKD